VNRSDGLRSTKRALSRAGMGRTGTRWKLTFESCERGDSLEVPATNHKKMPEPKTVGSNGGSPASLCDAEVVVR
jgi:hypothetical protein